MGFTVGAVLLIGAVAFALMHTDFSPLRNARPVQIVELAGAVAANLLLAGTLFWVVTLSFDAVPPVRWGRMVAVVCAECVAQLSADAGGVDRAGGIPQAAARAAGEAIGDHPGDRRGGDGGGAGAVRDGPGVRAGDERAVRGGGGGGGDCRGVRGACRTADGWDPGG